MQGLLVDMLTSKRIPAASKLSSLKRVVADYATRAVGANQSRHVVMASDPTVKAATSRGAVSHVVSSTPVEYTRVYDGTMTLSGTISATSGQHGTWSGTLQDSLIITTDRTGNGTGFEIFSGNINLTVTNPDGSQKSVQSPLDFYTPDFSLQHGRFTFSQSNGLDFSGLMMTLNLHGAFSNGQATISEYLYLPFVGFVNGTLASGAIKGSSLVTTPALTISGGAPNQTTYASSAIKPFGTVAVTDLNNAAITATVTLSKPTDGTLTNLAGGTYNRAKGVYTITGSETAVNQAIKGVAFDPAANQGLPGHRTPTNFTLSITDSKGASLTDHTSVTTIFPLSIKGILPHRSTTGQAVAPFRNVTVGDLVGGDVDTVRVTLSDPKNGTLENLSGGIYNKITGVYLLHASAAAATSALRGLKFDPATSSGSAVTTGFTISVRNPAGASITNSGTTVIASAVTPAAPAMTGVALFSQYVASGLHRMPHHVPGISALHDLPLSSQFEFAASHR